MSHALAALAAVALLGVIVAQDWLYAPFRQQTVSQGLNGPSHVALDVALAALAMAIVWVSLGHALLEIAASVTALGLVGIAVTNTAWRWVDSLAGRLGGHEPWHLRFTVVVFVGAAAFELLGDHGSLWGLSAANITAPAVVWALSRRQDYAEKVGVLLLCVWLATWALSR